MNQDRGHFLTEQRNPRSMDLDRLSTPDAFDVINREDSAVAAAVAAAKSEICAAVDLVAAAFRSGGRLIYVGAGTSGRLGVLDAAECPPTFLSDPAMVRGVIAGGWDALRGAIEGAEDHPERGAAEIDTLEVGPRDVIMGIATGGSTPFVHGALAAARRRGAKTVFFACVPRDQCADDADVSIRVLVGPEILTGSTRMKAGTATKLTLNALSTLAMVRIGKIHENLMVDVNTRGNRKLVDRGARIIAALTGLERDRALALLNAAGGHVKSALVMHHRGVDCAAADALLQQAGGRLRDVLPDGAARPTALHGARK